MNSTFTEIDVAEHRKFAWYENRPYLIVSPQADTEELAERGDRLMFRHETGSSRLFIAPKGMQWSGYVLGVFA